MKNCKFVLNMVVVLAGLLVEANAFGLDDLPEDCGSLGFNSKIIHGSDAPEGQYPSYVDIFSQYKSRVSTCGGVIISDQHILTAAHCVFNISTGEEPSYLNVFPSSKTPTEEDIIKNIYKSENICRSDKYRIVDLFDHRYDVAVIKLERRIDLSGNVRAACLTQEPIQRGDELMAVGKGLINEAHQTVPDVLQELPLILDTEADFRHESFISLIAKDSGKAMCYGDSGSGVYKIVDGRSTVFGLASFLSSLKCTESRSSSYANLHFLREEIDELLGACA